MNNPVSATQSLPRPRTRSRSARRVVSLVGLGGAVLVAAGLGVVAAVSRPDGKIATGVRMAGQELGGKTPEQAKQQLSQWAEQLGKVKFKLKFAPETGITRSWKSTAGELGLRIDEAATLSKIQQTAQPGVLARVASFVSPSKQTQDIPPVVTVDEKKLRAVLGQISLGVNRRAKNAKIRFVPGGFNVTKEKPGVAMDIDASVQAVHQSWEAFQKTLTQPAGTPGIPSDSPTTEPPTTEIAKPAPALSGIPKEPIIAELAAKTTQPKITAALLKQIDMQPMGEYTTHFGGTGASRGSNIALATGKIDGTVLAPGDIFSYNGTVGPRIASAGFRDAPVIVKGELVPGIGGGICQVSSTLYNAVLLSDLKIVRRSHHAFPVHYLPAGRDATVVDGAIDFQFQNNTDTPIVIAASSGRGRLSFRVLGKRTPGKSVSIALEGHTIQPAPVKTISDKSLPAGKRVVEDKGHRGHHVTVYRVVKQDGEVVKKERIGSDVYRTFPAVVRVGTKVAAKPIAAGIKPAIRDGAAAPASAPALPSEPVPTDPPQ